MKRTLALTIAAIFLLTIHSIPAFAGTITVTDGRFLDNERGRTIPYSLYAPDPVPTPAPVVIFSHGLGGSRAAASYLGEALAKAGYLGFFIQHEGTDETLWRGLNSAAEIKTALRQSLRDKRAILDRYADIPFVIDELTRLSERGEILHGLIDLDRIGMAGHSFGARGVMIAAGEKNSRFRDPRIKAAIALSPNLPESDIGKSEDELRSIYTGINIPLFHITGTNDRHPFRQGFDPLDRTIPFRLITAPDQYLLVLDGADHATFGAGSGILGKRTSDAPHHKLIGRAAVMFFDAYLKGNRQAKSDLQVGLTTLIKPQDRYEQK